jgi:hypothetical protein
MKHLNKRAIIIATLTTIGFIILMDIIPYIVFVLIMILLSTSWVWAMVYTTIDNKDKKDETILLQDSIKNVEKYDRLVEEWVMQRVENKHKVDVNEYDASRIIN